MSISDSTSKCSVLSERLAQVSKCISRKPHCVSGRGLPARRESCRLIHEFTCRRSQGMACALCMRLPMINKAPVCPAQLRKAGMSSGACWPSPSSVTAHSKPCFAASANPVLSAAPLPRFVSCLTILAPAAWAASEVLSVEPSSTTTTSGRCWSAAPTKPAIVAPSLKQGITAAQVGGPSMCPA